MYIIKYVVFDILTTYQMRISFHVNSRMAREKTAIRIQDIFESKMARIPE
jgi:hypothetical protein